LYDFGTINIMANVRFEGDQQIGYEPDHYLAVRQIKELVESLNRFKIKTAPVADPRSIRIVRLRLSPAQEELRALVERWMLSGPNLRKMYRAHESSGAWPLGA
jgi:hypothetical protein